MVDFKKIDELREREAEVRKSFKTWARGLDPALLIAAVVVVVVVILIAYVLL